MARRRAHGFRLVLVTILILVGLLATALSVGAVEFMEEGDVAEGEVVDDDLFVAGDAITIDGEVEGDLFAFGRSVTVNGRVYGSLFAVVQTVTVNGEVGGSVYAGSAAMQLGSSAAVGRNVYYGGYSLEAEEGSAVEQDLLFGGYQAVLAGGVGRHVRVGAGALEVHGSVGGDVIADVGAPDSQVVPFMGPFVGPSGPPPTISPGIRIAEDAEIGGEVRYTSSKRQNEAIKMSPSGGIVYRTPVPEDRGDRDDGEPMEQPRGVGVLFLVGRWILARLRELITLLLLGVLVIWLLPDLLRQAVDQGREKALPAAGWGLLAWIAGYVVLSIAAVAVLIVGILLGIVTLGALAGVVFGLGVSSLALVGTAFVLLVKYGSKIVVAVLVGRAILEAAEPEPPAKDFWPLVLGVVLYVLLRAIPIVGWFVGLAATLVGLGAIALHLRERRGEIREAL